MQTGCSGFFQQQRKGWEYNLLLSLKAVQKRISDSQAGGAELFYTPAFSKRQYDQTLINETLGRTYGSSLEMILAGFCGKTSVSSKDIDRIRGWLKELEQELGEE